jgi:DNA-directed RNA polymerase specialized sigma subunit
MGDHGDGIHDLNRIRTEEFISNQKVTADLVLGRAKQLDKQKKALLRIILDQGGTYHQVARLSGEHASTVSRRFRAIMRRLRSRPLFAANADLNNLTPLEKNILIESFVYGTGQEQIAEKLGVSRYRVRKALDHFKATGHKQQAVGSRQ